MIRNAVIITISCLIAVGCGSSLKVKGKTEHEAKGEVRVVQEIVFRIDVSGCENLEGAAQGECITETVKSLGNLAEMVKVLACKDEECINTSTAPVGNQEETDESN